MVMCTKFGFSPGNEIWAGTDAWDVVLCVSCLEGNGGGGMEEAP